MAPADRAAADRGLTWCLLLLVASGCGPTGGSVEESPAPLDMWSGVHARERPGGEARKPTGEASRNWSPELDEPERERLEQAAWNAVMTPQTWSRYFEFPESADGLTRLSRSGIRCSVDPHDFGTVDVAIPSGAFVGWHPTYIGVTVARGTGEVLHMYSSFWP